MDNHEERLVARLRHHNPSLTVTELHIDRIDADKKGQVIDFLHSLKLKPSVESSAGLETVVSIDISSNVEQHDLFHRLVTFIRDLGIGDISVSSEPFDERQPEIEATDDSFLITESLSRDYTALNSRDIEELISRDKSESEYELIIDHPGQSSSRREPLQQSSKDIIGSLLRVNEAGRSQERQPSSERSIKPPPKPKSQRIRTPVQLVAPVPNQQPKKPTIWSRAKNVFKRKRPQTVHTVQYFNVQLSQENLQTNLKDNKSAKGFSCLNNLNIGTKSGKNDKKRALKNKVSINTLQKRLERVSQELFRLQNRRIETKRKNLSLDAWTQTLIPSMETISEDCSTQTITSRDEKQCRSNPRKRNGMNSTGCYIGPETSLTSGEVSLSEVSDSTISEDPNKRSHQRPTANPRGMIRNVIPIYPNQAPYFKQPVMYSLNPVEQYNKGGKLFFRRLSGTKASSQTRSMSVTRTTATSSLKSVGSSTSPSSSTESTSSKNTLINMDEEDDENTLCKKCIEKQNTEDPNSIKCGLVTAINESPFENETQCIQKITQTSDPDQITTQTNTSGLFTLPKITQTKTTDKKRNIVYPNFWTQTFGTQTSACSSSTSCSELVAVKSRGTKTKSNEKIDSCNSCDLIPANVEKENKKIGPETVLRCDTCNEKLAKDTKKNCKEKSLRPRPKKLPWRQLPLGCDFGQRVVPVMSLGSEFPLPNPFAQMSLQQPPNRICPKICSLFGNRRKALKEELERQNYELLQMKTILVAINEEILADTDTSSDDNYPSSYQQISQKQQKKVTFREPLVE